MSKKNLWLFVVIYFIANSPLSSSGNEVLFTDHQNMNPPNTTMVKKAEKRKYHEDSQATTLDDYIFPYSQTQEDYYNQATPKTTKQEDKKVLILSHKGLDPFRENKFLMNIHEILDITPENIVFMIPSNKKSEKDVQDHLIYLDDYSNDVEFHRKIEDLRDEFSFTHIVPLGEYDVLRSSRVREEYELPGMKERECLFFRDKLSMIGLMKKAGFKVPESQGIRTFPNLRSFARRHVSKQIIVKPLAGVSGKNTWVIKDEPSLKEVTEQEEFSRHFRDSSIGQHPVFIVQEFIDLPMFHVDGFFDTGGEVKSSWPCLYSSPPLLLNEGHVVSSSILEDSPFARYLNEYAKGIVGTMSKRIKTSGVFHLEGFYEPELREMTDSHLKPSFEKIIFCEIAARPGGFTIPEQWEKAFGVNLIAEAIKLATGMESLESISEPKSSMGIIVPWKSSPESSNTTFVLKGKEDVLWEFYKDIVRINSQNNSPSPVRLKRACSHPEAKKPNKKEEDKQNQINSLPT